MNKTMHRCGYAPVVSSKSFTWRHLFHWALAKVQHWPTTAPSYFSRPPQSITIGRDSVCMGDDAGAPNAAWIPLVDDETLADFVNRILLAGYPYNIQRPFGTWIFHALSPHEAQSKKLAVVSGTWTEPLFLVDPSTKIQDYVQPSAPILHFYLTRADDATRLLKIPPVAPERTCTSPYPLG